MQRLLTNSLTDKKKEKEGEGEREREIDRLPIRNRRSRLWTGTPSKQHTSCNGSQSEWPGCALRLAAVALLCSQDVSTYDCYCTLYVIPAGEVNTVEWEWDWCDLEGRLWDSSMLLEYSIWISMHFMYFIFIRILVISYSNVFMLKFLIQFFLMSTSRSRTFFVGCCCL